MGMMLGESCGVFLREIEALGSAGVNDLCVFPFETEPGEVERTMRFLAEL